MESQLVLVAQKSVAVTYISLSPSSCNDYNRTRPYAALNFLDISSSHSASSRAIVIARIALAITE